MGIFNKSVITPFNFYCQHVLPLVYDESLSYYEVLCKLHQKLNEVITVNNDLQSAFDNLQKWIDEQLEKYAKDKLESWLIDGTLISVIATTLNLNRVYENVAQMIADTNLMNGMYVQTQGYFTQGDYGASNYSITNKLPVDNGFTLELKNGLYAILIEDSEMNILQYGVKTGQDISETMSKIKTNKLQFNKGLYLSNNVNLNNIELQGNDTTIRRTNVMDTTNYTFIVNEVSTNVKIKGIIFDQQKHALNEQERVIIINGRYVTIENCEFTNLSCDGILIDSVYTSDTSYFPNNINVNHCVFRGNNFSRNCVSILDGYFITVEFNSVYRFTHYSMPGFVDIEPWNDNEHNIHDIVIRNNIIRGGFGNIVNVYINDNYTLKNPFVNICINENIKYDDELNSTNKNSGFIGLTQLNNQNDSNFINQNIDIMNNRFYGKGYITMIVTGVKGVNITNNTIESTGVILIATTLFGIYDGIVDNIKFNNNVIGCNSPTEIGVFNVVKAINISFINNTVNLYNVCRYAFNLTPSSVPQNIKIISNITVANTSNINSMYLIRTLGTINQRNKNNQLDENVALISAES